MSDVLDEVEVDYSSSVGYWCLVCGTLQAIDSRGGRRILTFVPKNAAAAATVGLTADEGVRNLMDASRWLRGKVFSATDDHL